MQFMRWLGDLMVVALESGHFDPRISSAMFSWEKHRAHRAYVYLGENSFCTANLIMGQFHDRLKYTIQREKRYQSCHERSFCNVRKTQPEVIFLDITALTVELHRDANFIVKKYANIQTNRHEK